MGCAASVSTEQYVGEYEKQKSLDEIEITKVARFCGSINHIQQGWDCFCSDILVCWLWVELYFYLQQDCSQIEHARRRRLRSNAPFHQSYNCLRFFWVCLQPGWKIKTWGSVHVWVSRGVRETSVFVQTKLSLAACRPWQTHAWTLPYVFIFHPGLQTDLTETQPVVNRINCSKQ